MKLYAESEREEILRLGGILLETVDCIACDRTFVPHLATFNGQTFGLCDEHIRLWDPVLGTVGGKP